MDNEAGNLAMAFVEPLLSQYQPDYEPEVPPEVPSDYPQITYQIENVPVAVPVAVVPQGTVPRIEYVEGNTNLATLSPV